VAEFIVRCLARIKDNGHHWCRGALYRNFIGRSWENFDTTLQLNRNEQR